MRVWEVRAYADYWYEVLVGIEAGQIVEAVLRFTASNLIVSHWVAEGQPSHVDWKGVE